MPVYKYYSYLFEFFTKIKDIPFTKYYNKDNPTVQKIPTHIIVKTGKDLTQ